MKTLLVVVPVSNPRNNIDLTLISNVDIWIHEVCLWEYEIKRGDTLDLECLVALCEPAFAFEGGDFAFVEQAWRGALRRAATVAVRKSRVPASKGFVAYPDVRLLGEPGYRSGLLADHKTAHVVEVTQSSSAPGMLDRSSLNNSLAVAQYAREFERYW